MKDREEFCQLRHGVEQCLDSNESILNASWSDRCGANPTDLSTWERRNGQLLPEDLREFFLLWDGVTCRWDVVAHGREVTPLGRLCVNTLSQLVAVDSSWLRNERNEPRPDLPAAATSAGLRAFDLDLECECGRVLLLLGLAGSPRSCEIWFQDVSCELTRLASSFSEYFRMLCMSLGLPRWQYVHTEAGLDPTSRQWFRLLAPAEFDASQISSGSALSHTDVLSLLDRGGVGQQAAPRLVAAGNPRSAIALLNSGAHGTTTSARPPLCLVAPGGLSSSNSCGNSRHSSATSTSSANHGGAAAHQLHPRPSGAVAQPTGDPRRKLRRAGHALLKRGGWATMTGPYPAPELDE